MSFVTALASVPKNAEASQIIGTINSLVAQINSLIVNPLNEVIYPTIPSAPVNLLGVTVGNAGSPVFVAPNGGSVNTNVGLILAGRGSGPLSLGGTGASANASIQVVNLANAVNFLQVTGATSATPTVIITTAGATTAVNLRLATQSTGTIGLQTGGTTRVTVGTSQVVSTLQITAPNYIATASPAINVANAIFVAGGGANNRIWSTGADTSTLGTLGIFLAVSDNSSNLQVFAATATGQISMGSATGGTAEALRLIPTTNGANFVQVTGATSAAPTVIVAASGATTDINIAISSQGAGTIKYGTSGMISANATNLNLLASKGPANSRSDVQQWLRVLDSTGASFFMPMW